MATNFSVELKQIKYTRYTKSRRDEYLFLDVPLRNSLNAIFSQAILLGYETTTTIPLRAVFCPSNEKLLSNCCRVRRILRMNIPPFRPLSRSSQTNSAARLRAETHFGVQARTCDSSVNGARHDF